MIKTKLILEVPIDNPLKAAEKTKLTDDLILAFKKVEILDAKVADSYYMEKRALAEPLNLVLVILTAAADITTIVMAVWAFLKEHDSEKRINLEVGHLKLTIRGNMSAKEVVEIVKEARKIANKEKG